MVVSWALQAGACFSVASNEFIKCALEATACDIKTEVFKSSLQLSNQHVHQCASFTKELPLGRCYSNDEAFFCTGSQDACPEELSFEPYSDLCLQKWEHAHFGSCQTREEPVCLWSRDGCDEAWQPITKNAAHACHSCDSVKVGACQLGEELYCAVSENACDADSHFLSWRELMDEHNTECSLCATADGEYDEETDKTSKATGRRLRKSPDSSTGILGPNRMTKVDVLVGGAGFAGIGAGLELANAGVDYYILEASERIGGRVLNGLVGSGVTYPVELGAQYISGLEGNPLWEMVMEVGLQGSVQNFASVQLYDENGNLDQDEGAYNQGSLCLKSFEAYLGTQQMGRFCFAPEAGDEFFNNTVQEFCQDELGNNFEYADDDDISVAEGQILVNGFSPPNESNEAVARVCEFYNVDFSFGGRPQEVSVADSFPIAINVDFELGSYFVHDRRGFKFLAEKYGAQYLQTTINTNTAVVFNDSRLQLRRKVIKVEWDPNGATDVKVTSCMTAEPVITTDLPALYPCIDNPKLVQKVSAKQFISTFSLGVLKESRQMEIDLGYMGGDFDLTQTQDRAPLFDPPLSSVERLSRAIETSGYGYNNLVYMQFASKFWPDQVEFFLSAHTQDGHIGDFAPIWMSLDNGVQGLNLDGSNIIALLVVGDRSLELNRITTAEITAQVLPVLNSMFNTMQTTDDVVDIELKRWADDPLFRGMGLVDELNSNDFDAFQEPFGNLIISGEVSCDRHGGWVHGALLGGKKATQELLHANYGQSVPELSLCDFTAEEIGADMRRLEAEEHFLRKGMNFVSKEVTMENIRGPRWNELTNEDIKQRFEEYAKNRAAKTSS